MRTNLNALQRLFSKYAHCTLLTGCKRLAEPQSSITLFNHAIYPLSKIGDYFLAIGFV